MYMIRTDFYFTHNLFVVGIKVSFQGMTGNHGRDGNTITNSYSNLI